MRWFDRHEILKLLLKRILYTSTGEVDAGKRMKLYHIRRYMSGVQVRRGARILEAGCGDGVFSIAFARWYPEAVVTGFDRDAAQVQACERVRHLLGPHNLRFVHATAHRPPQLDAQDYVCLFDVLEYISDDVGALHALGQMLAPDGRMLIHCPSRYYLGLNGAFRTLPDSESHRQFPGHVRHGYTYEELTTALQQAGLIVDQMEWWHGPLTHLAFLLQDYLLRYRAGRALRALSTPVVSLIVAVDARIEKQYGNTLWVVARRSDQGIE